MANPFKEKVELSKEQRERMFELAREITGVFNDYVVGVQDVQPHKRRHSVVSTCFRPYLEFCGKPPEVEPDRREREWSVDLSIWNDQQQVPDQIVKYETEVCTGMKDVVDYIRECYEETHKREPDAILRLREESLRQRLGSVYSNIASGGKTSTKIRYVLDEHYYIWVRLARHDGDKADVADPVREERNKQLDALHKNK